MKIKTIQKNYSEVLKLPRAAHFNPRKPSGLLWSIVRLISKGDLKDVDFTYSTRNMEKAGKGPWLILMNHSSFLDFEIAAKMLNHKPFSIVCTSDAFVGKCDLMRKLGIIPTRKFVPDINLINDMRYCLTRNRTSVLMYPEASYSFDGTTTPLPRHLGILLKKLGVPVVMITTYGSFTRDPLYNNLQKRRVRASAVMECLLSTEEIEQLPCERLDAVLDKAFELDYFKWQKDNGIMVDEPFRADGLHRILYTCQHCGTQGCMHGEGEKLRCGHCGKTWRLDESGRLIAVSGETGFAHIPDWYRWERDRVREEITSGSYDMQCEVSIGVMVDYKAIYMVGDGVLRHSTDGFTLDGCDGKLHYAQKPERSYSVYSDYFWYEIGDVVCIGDNDILYYCFPKDDTPVAKVRLAGEELYKLRRAKA